MYPQMRTRERDRLTRKARAILDRADRHNRDLTAEEEAKFDRIMDQVDSMDGATVRGRRFSMAQHTAFARYLREGFAGLTASDRRDLKVSPDTQGGFLVAPQQFAAQLIAEVDDTVPLRGLATTAQLTEGESLGVPALDIDISDPEWTTELSTGTEDEALAFGKRELSPHPLAKRIKVSRQLLRQSTLDAEDIVRAQLRRKFAETLENAYMTGDGASKPLGLFTASSQGISTSRDSTIGSAGSIPLDSTTGDQLIDAKYTLKPQYHNRARWLFHRDLIRDIRKIKDANNNYVWQPGLAGDRPDTILEVPYVVSEFVPNTVAAGNYVGMLGDFSFYWIVDSLMFEVQRLVELYAETDQVGFIARYEGDGMPVLEEPFVRLIVG